MSTIINGTSSAITFPDSTVQNTAALPLTGGTVTGDLSVTNNLSFNSGYGSSAVAYGCRAWVNFNGVGTVAIRASGNVSSITDNGTGDYTVNFTTAMPDANYSVNFGTTASSGSSRLYNYACIDFTDLSFGNAPTASAVRIRTGSTGSSATSADYRDVPYQYVSIFR